MNDIEKLNYYRNQIQQFKEAGEKIKKAWLGLSLGLSLGLEKYHEFRSGI